MHPLEEKILTYDFQSYSSLGKEKTLNEIENAFSVWQNVCNLKFEKVFDESQVMKIAFLTDDEKQNAEMNCPYKLNKKKNGNLALWRMASTQEIQHCLGICILTVRDGQTRKQFQRMESSTYFQSLFSKLVIASDCFTILKTKTVLCSQFINLDSVSKTRTIDFLNLTSKQCKKCMVQQNM